MTKRSEADEAFRDRLGDFSDRETVVKLFKQYLRSKQGNNYLFAIKGDSGTGKTFLVSHLSLHVCPQLKPKWHTGQLILPRSKEPDFRSILAILENVLASSVPSESFLQYLAKCEEYTRRFNENTTFIFNSVNIEATDRGVISGVDVKAQVDAQLRERERYLRNDLSRAFINLSKDRQYPLCLFIDGYDHFNENASDFIPWLFREILYQMSEASPWPLRIMVCGWECPNVTTVEPYHIEYAHLEDFNLTQVKSYLQNREVIFPTGDSITARDEDVVTAFYNLTKGRPLILDLAVTYFKELSVDERTAQNLQAGSSHISEQARVKFLQERLLERLSEPYRTMLERGPVLRTFDKTTLQELLNIELEGEALVDKLTDSAYRRFLQYPFINSVNVSYTTLPNQLTFHDLVRQVQLEALRSHHPETKEQLHLKLVHYYVQLFHTEQDRRIAYSPDGGSDSRFWYIDWFLQLPEKEFRALLEYLYHALQVTDLQADAFKEWDKLIGLALGLWQRKHAELLLEIMHQLSEQGEPILSETNRSYGMYLVWYSRSLEQETRWEEARTKLEEAARVFERLSDLSDAVGCLNSIGDTYYMQGRLEQALSYHEQALRLSEQVNDPTACFLSLNHICSIYYLQGKLEQALTYAKQSLNLSEQLNDPRDIATSYNSIGEIYRKQGKIEEAASYHMDALTLRESVGDPTGLASSLNNVGLVYYAQGKAEEALDYFERALTLNKQLNNPRDIAHALGNLGGIYYNQGRIEESLSYFEQALPLQERIGNPVDIAHSLVYIGVIYQAQGRTEEALDYFVRALALQERIGNPEDIAYTLKWICGLYNAQGRTEEAVGYFVRALALQERIGNPEDIARYLNHIGFIYRQQGQLDKALDYYQRALSFAEKVGNPADIARSLITLGEISAEQEKSDQSLSYFERALPFKEQIGKTDYVAILLTMGRICFVQEQWGQALSYFKQALRLKEHIENLIDVAHAHFSIGYVYFIQERWEQAIVQLIKSLKIYERLEDNPESFVALNLNVLALCYYKLDEPEKAMLYRQRAK